MKHYDIEYSAFAKFIKGERIQATHLVVLILKSFVAIFEMFIRYIPGGFGYSLRYLYYKTMVKIILTAKLIAIMIYMLIL